MIKHIIYDYYRLKLFTEGQGVRDKAILFAVTIPRLIGYAIGLMNSAAGRAFYIFVVLRAMVAEKLEAFLNKIEKVWVKLRPFVPFSYANIVWRGLDKQSQSILDVGCGKAEPMVDIKRRRNFNTLVGVDIFAPYLEECKAREIHHEYVLCDARNLPFRNQRHRAVWFPAEMNDLGYKVRGCNGLPKLCNEVGLIARLPKVCVELRCRHTFRHKLRWHPGHFKLAFFVITLWYMVTGQDKDFEIFTLAYPWDKSSDKTFPQPLSPCSSEVLRYHQYLPAHLLPSRHIVTTLGK